MTVAHTNRRGETYYLHAGETSTGRPRYFFAKTEREEGTVDETPEGYEIYESIRGQVFLRRQRPSVFTELELRRLDGALEKYTDRARREIKDDRITVYERCRPRFMGLTGMLGLERRMLERLADEEISVRYEAVFRLTLQDVDTRRFDIARMHFTLDTWYHLDDGQLQTLLETYLPHVGEESFFELV